MLEFENIHLFILAAPVLNLSPGNEMLFVISRTLSFSIKVGLYLTLGVFSGCLVHFAFAPIKRSAIIMKFSMALEIIRYLGTAYLIYFGVMSFLKKRDTYTKHIAPYNLNNKKLVLQGIITVVINPMVAIFILAFLSQFVNKYSDSVWFQFLFLGVLFNIFVTLLFMGIVYMVHKTFDLFRNNFFWKCQEKIAETVLIGLCLKMALDNRK